MSNVSPHQSCPRQNSWPSLKYHATNEFAAKHPAAITPCSDEYTSSAKARSSRFWDPSASSACSQLCRSRQLRQSTVRRKAVTSRMKRDNYLSKTPAALSSSSRPSIKPKSNGLPRYRQPGNRRHRRHLLLRAMKSHAHLRSQPRKKDAWQKHRQRRLFARSTVLTQSFQVGAASFSQKFMRSWARMRANPSIEGMPKRLRLLCTPHVKR